jgi:hypothetical protein
MAQLCDVSLEVEMLANIHEVSSASVGLPRQHCLEYLYSIVFPQLLIHP